jgi:predicted Zn-dependent peptidase
MALEQQVFHHTYDNGLTLVAQPMPWLESAAFSISVPAGFRYDPVEKLGTANFACEMVQRGCGKYNSREFIEALESLGVDFNSSASIYNTNYGGAMQAAQLHESLAIFADVLRRPRFPAEQLEDGRQVCFQEVKALEDDLSQRAMLEMRRRFYGDPDGRQCEGTMESVAAVGLDDLQNFYEQNYRPNGLIIACAGKLDWEKLKLHIGGLFDDWNQKPEPVVVDQAATHGVHHIPYESEQTHIVVAYPGVAYAHEDYFLNRGAVGVMSGGMSSRLFTEIREKRGLCYTVYATCHSLKDKAAVFSYSGTSSERAQETLDVLIEQLKELANGIREDELRRLKIQIRSGMVMQQESCRSRAGSIAGDWFHLGRVRTLDEMTEKINGLSVESINDYLSKNPPANFDVVTLGSQPLEIRKDGLSPTSVG